MKSGKLQARAVLSATPHPRSLLRYPGGKSRAVPEIMALIPPHIKRLASPFIGGGSVEIACAANGMEVFGYDVFEPLVNFWKQILRAPLEIKRQAEKYHPLSRAAFYALQADYQNIKTKGEKAAAFYVLNRSSFSGTTLSGGMSPDHPRFTKSSLDRLGKFRIQGLRVEKMDFRDSIAKHQRDFLYLDPPYLNGQKLYGMRGDTHHGFDHLALARLLKRRGGWILSYNDCACVRKLYDGYQILTPQWTYGMGGEKKSSEVLILSADLS